MPDYLRQALVDPTPALGKIELAGRWSLFAIVAAGVLITLTALDGPWYAPAGLALVALGAAYLAVFVYLGAIAERSEDRLVAVAYVALQLALAAAMFAIPASQGSFNMTWLILMPLIGHAVFLLRPLGVLVTSFAAVGLVCAHGAWLGGFHLVGQVAPGVTLAVVFVVLFANVTRLELVARTRSETLREELEEAHARLSAYSVQAAELATHRERNRMAREIHDTVGHHLTVVSVQLEAAEVVLDRDPEDARRRIVRAKELTREGLAEVRRSVGALRASPLDGRSLDDAIRALTGGTDGPAARVRVTGEPREVGDAAALTLYRVAQEGLTNARRHARAIAIDLEIDYRAPDAVRLAVRDDGAGTDLAADGGFGTEGSGFGLLGLHERVHLLGGRMTVDSHPGDGFVLEVEVPS